MIKNDQKRFFLVTWSDRPGQPLEKALTSRFFQRAGLSFSTRYRGGFSRNFQGNSQILGNLRFLRKFLEISRRKFLEISRKFFLGKFPGKFPGKKWPLERDHFFPGHGQIWPGPGKSTLKVDFSPRGIKLSLGTWSGLLWGLARSAGFDLWGLGQV